VAQDKRAAKTFWQLEEFLVERLQEFSGRDVSERIVYHRLCGRCIHSMLAGGVGASLLGQSQSNTVQPRSDGMKSPNACRLASQDQKRRLKDVLGVVRVAERPATDTKNQWTVASDQFSEGGLVSVVDKLLHQDGVGQQSIRRDARQVLDVPQDQLGAIRSRHATFLEDSFRPDDSAGSA